MGYQTQRQKITEYIEKKLLPLIQKTDLDYYKVLEGVSGDLGTSKSMVEDVLLQFINNGKVAEHRVLTIPKEKVKNWLEEYKRNQNKIKEEINIAIAENEYSRRKETGYYDEPNIPEESGGEDE